MDFINSFLKLNYKTGLILSFIIGIVIFYIFFEPAILDPSNTAWIIRPGGDQLQNYLGSYAFRYDNWHFPLTKTTFINYPEGISIVYTDSNPFLSIIAKLFKSVFPPEYQVLGIWILICWALQSFCAYLIIYDLSKDVNYSLLGAIIFTLLPSMYYRFPHVNLVSHWILLLSIFIFITDRYKNSNKNLKYWLLLLFSSTVHAYLFFMVAVIFGIWLIKNSFEIRADKKALTNFSLLNTGGFISLIVILWVLGFFYNKPQNEGLIGFGYYSMNLNAFINPVLETNSKFFNPLMAIDGQQAEGFQFLGFGVILMFIAFVVSYISKQQYFKNKSYVSIFSIIVILLSVIKISDTLFLYERVYLLFIIVTVLMLIDYVIKTVNANVNLLLIPALICFLIALSNKVTLGQTTLFSFNISDDSILVPLCQTIRSSGRFFWVTNLIFLTILFGYFYKLTQNKLVLYGFMGIVICLQVMDMHKINVSANANDRNNYPSDPLLMSLIEKSESVHMMGFFDISIAKDALLKKKKINNYYMAHDRGDLSEKRYNNELYDVKHNYLDNNALYLVNNLNSLPISVNNVIQLPNNILAFSKNDNLSEASIKKISVSTDSISLHELLNRIAKDKLVIISAKDEASSRLSPDFLKKLDADYNSKMFDLKYRNSYVGVWTNGTLNFEQIGTNYVVEYSNIIENISFFVKSAGKDLGDRAEIRVSGFDFSINKRGLNCVTIDQAGNIHTFNFDTHGTYYPF